jgi:CBS domain-containing protein
MPQLREIMTEEVVFLLPDHTAYDAARKMKELNVGVIPVCDQDKRLLGLITDRDIVLRVVAAGLDADGTILQDCATLDPVAAQPDWDMEMATTLMSQHQIRRLPVVQNGKLVGIISLGDLATDTSARTSGAVLEQVSEPSSPRKGVVGQSSHTA